MTLKHLLITAAMLAAPEIVGTANAQQPDYQVNMDWSAHNWTWLDAGLTNCPAAYVALGVPQFILGGGRGAVMRYAAAFVFSNPPYAFQLVLLTQCHNPGAQQSLMQAGPLVLAYLPFAISK
jgi:hypothetical protein